LVSSAPPETKPRGADRVDKGGVRFSWKSVWDKDTHEIVNGRGGKKKGFLVDTHKPEERQSRVKQMGKNFKKPLTTLAEYIGNGSKRVKKGGGTCHKKG